MTLIFDIGNTNIKIAIYKNKELIQQWRISTDTKRTGDEYYSILRPLFLESDVDSKNIKKSVLSSVVPSLIGPFILVCQRFTGKKPLVVSKEIYDKLPLKLPDSAKAEIGTDLFCDAVEAWCKYKSPCIITDFGTALSFVVVDHEGNLAGVAIAPGIGTAFRSLFSNTAQLPEVPLEIPSTSLGKNTIVAIQSGIVLGYKGLVESLISQMKKDLQKENKTNPNDIIVIATGGLNSMLQPITDIYDYVEKNLTLEGMLRISNLMEEVITP